MEGSVAGVRIFPAVVQFNDAEPHVLHQMNLKVQNLSKFSKFVRFHSPNSKVKFIFVNVAGYVKIFVLELFKVYEYVFDENRRYSSDDIVYTTALNVFLFKFLIDK